MKTGGTIALTEVPSTEIDEELLDVSHSLRGRAGHLRSEAGGLDDVLADTYRRRASELELEAWVAEVQSGIPYDDVSPIAA